MIPRSRLLNLGCGTRTHADWVNLDISAAGPDVLAWDLRKGIPFPDATFSVVYHSHLLEHFPRKAAGAFLKECRRVLLPDCIIRIAVPDLESIAGAYLRILNRAVGGEEGAAADYDWILLELYDQTVRNYSGGEMAEYLLREDVVNEEFIFSRCGGEARRMREAVRRTHAGGRSQKGPPAAVPARKDRGSPAPLKQQLRRFREGLLKLILGTEYEALSIGRFRISGEIHQWMYDRYSLRCMLQSCGFQDVTQRSAADSGIPNWTDYCLDTGPDGSVYKPDSLYMEAVRR